LRVIKELNFELICQVVIGCNAKRNMLFKQPNKSCMMCVLYWLGLFCVVNEN
jgi:hypothetical protein